MPLAVPASPAMNLQGQDTWHGCIPLPLVTLIPLPDVISWTTPLLGFSLGALCYAVRQSQPPSPARVQQGRLPLEQQAGCTPDAIPLFLYWRQPALSKGGLRQGMPSLAPFTCA